MSVELQHVYSSSCGHAHCTMWSRLDTLHIFSVFVLWFDSYVSGASKMEISPDYACIYYWIRWFSKPRKLSRMFESSLRFNIWKCMAFRHIGCTAAERSPQNQISKWNKRTNLSILFNFLIQRPSSCARPFSSPHWCCCRWHCIVSYFQNFQIEKWVEKRATKVFLCFLVCSFLSFFAIFDIERPNSNANARHDR